MYDHLVGKNVTIQSTIPILICYEERDSVAAPVMFKISDNPQEQARPMMLPFLVGKLLDVNDKHVKVLHEHKHVDGQTTKQTIYLPLTAVVLHAAEGSRLVGL